MANENVVSQEKIKFNLAWSPIYINQHIRHISILNTDQSNKHNLYQPLNKIYNRRAPAAFNGQ